MRYLAIVLLCCIVREVRSKRHDGVLAKLMKCGFHPKHILDCGANDGAWSANMRTHFPTSKYLMIEGDSIHADELKATSIYTFYEIAVLSDTEKNVTFHSVQSKDGTENSILSKSNGMPSAIMKLKATTIDVIVKKFDFAPVQFIKLDVQGSELDALRGEL